MSRPSDIPSDIWNEALKCGETVCRNLEYENVTFEVTAIARAIMAAKAEEREACVSLCDREVELARNFGPHHIPIILAIKTAIRKRGDDGYEGYGE